ncbi:hypothetical protein HYX01_00335 [Candidatus Woesearchaeota archaeon]|nr:hypothetical protein [Candidatus Woesearchaeota archaeon]
MLTFIKNLFAKKHKPLEEIELSQLTSWLEEKSKPAIKSLESDITRIISALKEEKKNTLANIKKLETASLQNPNIPERAKIIMEGNKAAFIKKITNFVSDIDFELNADLNKNCIIFMEKCSIIENDINSLAKSTEKSYHILNEFFALEAEAIALNIKSIESHIKKLKNTIEGSKMQKINALKEDAAELHSKIKLKDSLIKELESEKSNLMQRKGSLSKAEEALNEAKNSKGYKDYEALLSEKQSITSEIAGMDNKLFHEFSVIERALRKYAKIAFEDEKIISHYLKNPVDALSRDSELRILRIMQNLEAVLVGNKLEEDKKRNEKYLKAVKHLNKEYFKAFKDVYRKAKGDFDKNGLLIKDNAAKNNFDSCNEETKMLRADIDSINSKIIVLNNEIEKINIASLKEELQKKINEVLECEIVTIQNFRRS